jgi:hypothetical protein
MSDEFASASDSDNDSDNEDTSGGRSRPADNNMSHASSKRARGRQKQQSRKAGASARGGSRSRKRESPSDGSGAGAGSHASSNASTEGGFTFDAMQWPQLTANAVAQDLASLFPLFQKHDTLMQMGQRVFQYFFIKNTTGSDDIKMPDSFLSKKVPYESTKRHKATEKDGGTIVRSTNSRAWIAVNAWKTWMQTAKLSMQAIMIESMGWFNTTAVSPVSIFGSFLGATQVTRVTGLFPAVPDIMAASFEKQGDNSKVPNKAILKSVIDDDCHAAYAMHAIMMKAVLSNLKWPKGGDPVTVFHSLRKSPKVWAKVMAILLFTHSGHDGKFVVHRALSIAKGNSTFGK